MKKVVFIALSAIVFTSCTREYTCDCVNPPTGETNKLVFRTNTKDHAIRLCDDYLARVKNSLEEKRSYTCKIN